MFINMTQDGVGDVEIAVLPKMTCCRKGFVAEKRNVAEKGNQCCRKRFVDEKESNVAEKKVPNKEILPKKICCQKRFVAEKDMLPK